MVDEDNRICKLLSYGINDGNVFLPNNKFASDLVDECLELYSRDNVCTTIDNSKGVLCSTYPVCLIIPLKQKQHLMSDENTDTETLKNEFLLSIGGRFARTRSRFPAPVLLFGNKIVCRSSTLARSPEIYSRTGYDYLMQGEASSRLENGTCNNQNDASHCESTTPQTNGHSDENSVHFNNGVVSLSQPSTIVNGNGSAEGKLPQKLQDPGKSKEWLVDKVRNADIGLLRALKVDVICDLMVENKKVKFGMNVTSSEKVDSENRYHDFGLISIPYPGCEFFADYTHNNYTGVGLKFDWKQTFVDAELQVPENVAQLKGVEWKDYIQWDLVKLTQNYLKLVLNCLVGECSSGILLHCISGWDRTPLFISLLRLSLWADGLIHQSLDAEEIVYLTLAYDWLLFSHQFYDRIYKNEEIMHFCFEFLKDITSAEYSVLPGMESVKTPLLNAATETEEVFVMENLCNGHEMKNGEDASQEMNACQVNGLEETDESEFEKVHLAQNCAMDGLSDFQDDGAGETAHPLLSLHDVKTCLNCIIANVAGNEHCNNSNHGHKEQPSNGNSIPQNASEKINGSTESVPAVLPLNSDDDDESRNFLPDKASIEQNFSQNAPQSALSSSFESAKAKIISKNQAQQRSQLDSLTKTMSSSLDLSEDILKHRSVGKSEPITVPLNSKQLSAVDCVPSCNSLSSSFSNATTAAEPGSSWQMVSSPSPQNASTFLGANSYTGSNQKLDHNFSQTDKASFPNLSSSPCNGTSEISELKLKLRKRKEKLEMAHNIMIPAYSSVVQKQREKQQDTMGLTAMLGSLVGFVKRA